MINDKENETRITLQLTDNQLLITNYFPMQQDLNFPKLLLRTINKADYQLVTRTICRSCDKIGISVTNSVTKLSFKISSFPMKVLIFGLKEKEWLFPGLWKSVTKRWLFQSSESIIFNWNHSKLKLFFGGQSCVLLTNSTDRCLVWLVYLIHRPDRTS